MKVVERMVQEIYAGQNEALDEIDKRYDVIEKAAGFPPKKRLWCISGPYNGNTIIIEREWESFAVMEATYEKVFANADYHALGKDVQTIVKSNRIEYFTPA